MSNENEQRSGKKQGRSAPLSEVDGDRYYTHWADIAARRTHERNADATQFTVAAGITPSGVIHVGNFREVITVDLVARALRDRGVDVRFIYSWDDFDVFRKVPVDMPEQDMLQGQLRRSVADVPDPFGETDSYASHHILQFERSLDPLRIEPEFIRQSRRYRAGDYAEGIVKALDGRTEIRRILDQHRKEPLPESWLPLAGFCAECGRDEIDFAWSGDGLGDEDPMRWQVRMHCRTCDHDGEVDLREGGDVKLPWRVDWPMRWNEEQVHFEPGGKDHSSAGGSYDTASEIVAAIYDFHAPEYVAYDFVRIKGRGGKISSSAGEAVTVADCLQIYEPDMLRWIFASVRPGSEFQISFDLDVIKLYEDYDRARRLAHEAEDGGKSDKKRQIARRTFELASGTGEQIVPGTEPPFVPPFRGLTMILQIFDGEIAKSRAHYEATGEITTPEEAELHDQRAECAWEWIELYAPDDFRYRIREEPVERALEGDDRIVIERLFTVLAENPKIEEPELIEALKRLCEGTGHEPKTFFPIAYDLLLGRDRGPKLSTLITTMGAQRALPLLRGGLGGD